MLIYALSTLAVAKAVEPTGVEEGGQGALALLVLIALVAGWMALRAMFRRHRQDQAPRT